MIREDIYKEDELNFTNDEEDCLIFEETDPSLTSDTEPKYKYTRDLLVSLMDKYHNGDEKDKKYVRNEFCIMLTPLIKKMIRTSRGIDSEYADYIQHCYLYICKRLDRFDPDISFPFEYFKYVIREAITSCHESSYGKSSHETNIDRKVRKKIREYDTQDIFPSPSRIASETGLSVRQAEDSISRILAEKPVLGDDMSVFDRDDGTNMPLDVILKNEVSEALKNAIDSLPSEEREVILLSYNFYELDSEYSNKKIAEVMHISELKVKELLILAKRHLKKDASLDQLVGRHKRTMPLDHDCHEDDPLRSVYDLDSCEYRLFDEEEADENKPLHFETNNTYVVLDRIIDISFYSY